MGIFNISHLFLCIAASTVDDGSFDLMDFDDPVVPSSPHSISHSFSPIPRPVQAIIVSELLAGTSSTTTIWNRIWLELPAEMWLTEEEVYREKTLVVRPIVQPVEFHKILWDLRYDIDPENSSFLETVSSRMPLDKYPEYADLSAVKYFVFIWRLFCIDPLRSWGFWAKAERMAREPLPCYLAINAEPDGSEQRRFTLADFMVKKFLTSLLEGIVIE